MPKKEKPFEKATQALREFCLRFPETIEDFPWGHSAFKVKKKVFLIIGGTDEEVSFSMKLPSSNRMALIQPYAAPTGYGLGKSGWVTATFKPDDRIPVDRLCEWTEESYRAVAPKKVVAAMDNPELAAKPKAKAKPKKRKA